MFSETPDSTLGDTATIFGIEQHSPSNDRVLEGVFNTHYPMMSFMESVMRVAMKASGAEIQRKVGSAIPEVRKLFPKLDWFDEKIAAARAQACLDFAQQFRDGTLSDVTVSLESSIGMIDKRLCEHPYKYFSAALTVKYGLTLDEIAAIRL